MTDRPDLRAWLRPPRRGLLLFSALTFLLLAALTFMATRAVRTERLLYQSRMQDEVRITGDLVSSQVNVGLARLRERLRTSLDVEGEDMEEALAVLREEIPGEVVAAVIEGERAVWYRPPDLLYPPVLPYDPPEQPAGVFREGDELEFREGDHAAAARSARGLLDDPSPLVRAEARVRLARNLAQSDRLDEALEVYRELEDQDLRLTSGYPASLFALYARALHLDLAARSGDAHEEAARLLADLFSGRWAIDHSTYHFFRKEAERFLQDAPETLLASLQDAQSRSAAALRNSEAIAHAWEAWEGRRAGGAGGPSRHDLLLLDEVPFSVHWMGEDDRLAAVAGRLDSLGTWFTPDLFETLRERSTRMTLVDQEGRLVYGPTPETDRYHVPVLPSETGLPWTLHLYRVDTDEGLASIRSRERTMLVGLLLVALLVGVSAWYMARAISREIDVARLKSDFVSAVSHEFRSPLTSIRQLSEMIAQDRVIDAGQRTKYFGVMQRESERLHRLVEDLLDFRRMEAGAKEFTMRPVDVAAMTAETCELFSEQMETRDYRIQRDIQISDVAVMGDREALSRALWNLLDNAAKYSPEEKKIWVTAKRSTDSVVLQVADQGVGIPEEERERIFERFVRGRSAQITSARGSGIGLSMVKHIVEAHGGTVSVASRPGEGTTFTIRLPVRRD